MKNFVGVGPGVEIVDRNAGAAVSPGYAVIIGSAGTWVLATTDYRGPVGIVQPKLEFGGDAADAYASGERCRVIIPSRGQLFYGFVLENSARAVGNLLAVGATVGTFSLAAASDPVQAMLLEAHQAATTATLHLMMGAS